MRPEERLYRGGKTVADAILEVGDASSIRLQTYGVDVSLARASCVPPIRDERLVVPWDAALQALPRELLAISPPTLHEPVALERLLRSVLIEALLVWRLDDAGLQAGMRLELGPQELRVTVPGSVPGGTASTSTTAYQPINPLLASRLFARGHRTDGPAATAQMAEDQGFKLSWEEGADHVCLHLQRVRTLVRAARLRRRARTPAAARRELILELLRSQPQHTATNRTLRTLGGFKRQTLSKDLKALEEAGLVAPTHPNRSSSYQAWQLTAQGQRA